MAAERGQSEIKRRRKSRGHAKDDVNKKKNYPGVILLQLLEAAVFIR